MRTKLNAIGRGIGPGIAQRSASWGLAALALLVSAGAALAQEGTGVPEAITVVEETKPVFDSGDTAWMLASTALVLMMTIPGLALFYCGMVRKKNVLDVAVQSFATCCLVTVLWIVIGYSLAFTDGGGLQTYIGGLDRLLLAGMGSTATNALAATIPESVFMTFQMTFAIITPALITGAFADRMKFSAVLWFMALWSLIVYAPIAHWVWGGGFLGGAGVLDFAGGTVVHINAGVAGLVCCLVLGKRKGYGIDNMAPHNLVLSLIGASLLWVGWFGFNAGSAVTAGGRAGMAMAVTQIATAAAALAWMFAEWIAARQAERPRHHLRRGRRPGRDHPGVGLRRSDRGPGHRHRRRRRLLLRRGLAEAALGYDDSLDVFGVHGIGGFVGRRPDRRIRRGRRSAAPGGLIEGNPGQVWTQIEGIARHHRLVRRCVLHHPQGDRRDHRPAGRRRGRGRRPRHQPARRNRAVAVSRSRTAGGTRRRFTPDPQTSSRPGGVCRPAVSLVSPASGSLRPPLPLLFLRWERLPSISAASHPLWMNERVGSRRAGETVWDDTPVRTGRTGQGLRSRGR